MKEGEERCVYCGHVGSDVSLGSDPYNEDLYGDYTEYWICDQCIEDRSMEI